MRGRDSVRALSLVPLLFAVPVAIGIIRSALDLIGVGHPFSGDISGTEVDATAIYLGQTPYHDPSTGFSGLIYTPLMAFLWGGLDHVRLWGGWGLLIVLLADLALVGLVARTAYGPRSAERAERLGAATGAVGIGALAFWLVTCVPFSFTFGARVDQPAWAAAFAGMLLMPRVAGGSRRAAVAVIVLLTVGNWFKQTVLPADAAAVAWLACGAVAGRIAWRRVLGFGMGLALANAIPLAVAVLLTDGWFWRFMVTMPAARPDVISVGHSLSRLLDSVAPALVVLAATSVAFVIGRRWRILRWPASRDGGLVALLLLFVGIDLVAAVPVRRALGSEDNQFVGIVWALGLLTAIAWRRTRARTATAVVAAAVVAVAFAATQSDGFRERVQNDLSVTVRPVGLRAHVAEVSPALIAYARHHRVYHPALSWVGALGERRVYPNHAETAQLLTTDYQPRYLASALLDRHFDAVFLFEDTPAEERLAGTGHFEDNYLWKLNEIVRANYAPAPRRLAALRAAGYLRMFFAYRSPGLYVRRAGPPRAAWMRHCFGPFDIGRGRWVIRRGGGFWCRPGGHGSTVRLVRTRAEASELRSADRAVALTGELAVGLPRARGEARVTAGNWTIRARRVTGRVRLDLADQSRVVASVEAAGARIALRFKRGPAGIRGHARRVEVALPTIGHRYVSVWATSGSDATFDLGNLRLVR